MGLLDADVGSGGRFLPQVWSMVSNPPMCGGQPSRFPVTKQSSMISSTSFRKSFMVANHTW